MNRGTHPFQQAHVVAQLALLDSFRKAVRESPVYQELVEKNSNDEAKTRIRERLWRSLAISRTAPPNAHTDAFRIFNDAIQELNRHHKETLALFQAIWMSQLSVQRTTKFDPSPHVEARRQQFADVLELEFPKAQPGSDDDVHLTRLPPHDAFSSLRDSARRLTNRFVDRLFSTLGALKQMQVVGNAHWEAHNAVKFSFFQTRLTEKVTEESTKGDGITPFFDPEFGWLKAKTLIAGTQTFVVCRESHSLLNTREHAIEAFPRHIPRRAQGVAEAIPDFLRAECTIVDGDLVRRDLAYEQQETQTCERAITQYHIDPAVILGQNEVLTAWNCSEADSDVQQLQRERFQRFQQITTTRDW